MILFDNHNHSQFSFDGKKSSIEESARRAIEKGLGGIAFTDHYDFFIPQIKADTADAAPETFDIIAQQAEVDRVQGMFMERNGFKILKGIEIGMYSDHHDDIRRVLSGHSFDQIIASVHYLDGTDPFYGDYYEDKDCKSAYGRYLETIWKEMTWFEDFDILGHYDYVARYAPYDLSTIRYKDFSDIMDEILRYLAYNGKALEINTKSYRSYNGREVTLDTDILKRYHELGGETISLGSDSHSPDRVGDGFEYYAQVLKSCGFRWNSHFEQRTLMQTPL